MAGQQLLLPLPDTGAIDLAKPVKRCIQSMYWHADAVDEIARIVEQGTPAGRVRVRPGGKKETR